jgi:hypothetical protein
MATNKTSDAVATIFSILLGRPIDADTHSQVGIALD